MSLSSQVAALASRIASEFNALRSEISTGQASSVDAGLVLPSSPFTGQTFLITDEENVYIYTGSRWMLMTQFGTLIDGGSAATDPLVSNEINGGTA